MPDTVERIERAEGGVGHAVDFAALLHEGGNSRLRFLARTKAHALDEIRALPGNHGELPAALGGETFLRAGRVVGDDGESRAVGQVEIDAIETIGPKGAIRAMPAHVMDEYEIALGAEKSGELHRAAGGAQGNVFHRFTGPAAARLGQIFLSLGGLFFAARHFFRVRLCLVLHKEEDKRRPVVKAAAMAKVAGGGGPLGRTMSTIAAILLRKRKLSDTSLIVHWCTDSLGVIQTVARGARRPKSPFAGKLDLFYEAEISIRLSRRTNLHTLAEAVLRNPFAGIRESYERTRAASYFVELIELCTETDHREPGLFELLQRALGFLDKNEPNRRALLHFERELARLAGVHDERVLRGDPAGALRDLFGRLPKSRGDLLAEKK